MVGLVTQCVTKHLTDARKFILSSKTKDHSEQTVKLGTFHTLPKNKNIFGKFLLLICLSKIHISAQTLRYFSNEFVFPSDGINLFEHSFTFVGINTQGTNHVKQTVGMNIFFVSVPPKYKFKFRCCN